MLCVSSPPRVAYGFEYDLASSSILWANMPPGYTQPENRSGVGIVTFATAAVDSRDAINATPDGEGLSAYVSKDVYREGTGRRVTVMRDGSPFNGRVNVSIVVKI